MNKIPPILQVLIGGLLSTLGGVTAIWYQAKKARQIKMDEIIAEKKVNATAEAYKKIKKIEGMLTQSAIEDVRKEVDEDQEWFFTTHLFLPGKFPDKWLSIRKGLWKACRLAQQRPDTADELTKLETNLEELAKEAIDEIYKEMKISRPNIKIPLYDR